MFTFLIFRLLLFFPPKLKLILTSAAGGGGGGGGGCDEVDDDDDDDDGGGGGGDGITATGARAMSFSTFTATSLPLLLPLLLLPLLEEEEVGAEDPVVLLSPGFFRFLNPTIVPPFCVIGSAFVRWDSKMVS